MTPKSPSKFKAGDKVKVNSELTHMLPELSGVWRIKLAHFDSVEWTYHLIRDGVVATGWFVDYDLRAL